MFKKYINSIISKLDLLDIHCCVLNWMSLHPLLNPCAEDLTPSVTGRGGLWEVLSHEGGTLLRGLVPL